MRERTKTIRPSGLKRQLRSDLKTIRSAYRRAQERRSAGELSPQVEWLTDHFHRLESAGNAALCGLEGIPPLPEQEGEIRIFSCCLRLCPDGLLPDQDALCRALAPEHLTVWETQLLPLMLRAALLHRAREAAEQPHSTVEHAVQSLLALESLDFEQITVQINETQRILMLDPAGLYPGMDLDTQARYRERTAYAAAAHDIPESREAAEILRQAREEGGSRHVGFALWARSSQAGHSRRIRGLTSLILPPVLALATAVLAAILSSRWFLAPVLFPLLWEIFTPPVRALLTYGIRPEPLPKMNLDGAIPEYARTLIVVSDLMPTAAGAARTAAHLEQLYRSNHQGAVEVLLLADYKGADAPTLPTDREDYEAMRREIDRLNDRHSGGFLLAVRDRTYSEAQGCYTGYERKRGAITQLIQAIHGEEIPQLHLYGCTGHLRDVKYLILLDSDTGLPFNAALEMVRTAIHPLNRPQIDPQTRRVTDGYGILVPEIAPSIESARATGFSRIMAGAGGASSYDAASANFYQDCFGQTVFSGKGIVDVDAFYTVMRGRIEEGTVLSHDILEGGFLRAGFLSGVTVTDGFPSREEPYLKRMHRWVRGDWQNIVFLKKRPYGSGSDNPAGRLTKYQLFDNLRRSFTSAAVFLVLLASPFLGGAIGALTAVSALVCSAAGDLFGCLNALLFGGMRAFSGRFYARVLPSAAAALARAGVQIITASRTGYTCLDAIVRALWRTAVSRKKMLEWTTAADSEKHKSSGIRPLLPSLLMGLYLIASLEWILVLVGCSQLADLFFDPWSAKKQEDTPLPDPIVREYASSCAAAQWRYYTEYAGASDNFLPPDNVQETPVARVAHRTSPTNIGMMMLCTLAARDFGFISSAELYTRLHNTISTVERLEKFRGNLLNWYDTRTLRPMEPLYVSTVDSGNFLGCITALRVGLAEYTQEEPRLTSLAERIDRLANGTNLHFLYHRQKNLFHIGYDVTQKQLSPSCYDLLMSEARLTSYYAVARRIVPKKHWASLGRTLARAGSYAGPISWTGTMFEYYMPHLLLPAYENTLLSEALRFCLHCHRERVRGRGIPWGISESGFYAFDPALNYQYKAHGVQKLGLKQGLDSDLVIAPYAAFLTLPFAPREAYRNLKAIEELEVTGRCGFYEAVDFTPSRTQGQDYAVVRSYMAHHVGMSMLACDNVVRGNIMQKRFLSDGDMSAANSILEEKVQQGTVFFDDIEHEQPPKRPDPPAAEVLDVYQIDRARPQMALLSNGEWNTAVTDGGMSLSLYRGASMTFADGDLLRRPCGIFCVVQAPGARFPINKALAGSSAGDTIFEASFTPNSAVLSAEQHALHAEMEILVHPRIPGEIRRFTVQNRRQARVKGRLLIYLEPSLALPADERAHPAFSRLFLTVEYDRSLHALVFTRRPRGEEPALSLAIGRADGRDFHFDTDRVRLLSRPEGIFSLVDRESPLDSRLSVKDVCAAVEIPFDIPPRGSCNAALVMTAAQTSQEAGLRLVRARLDAAKVPGAPMPFAQGSMEGVLLTKILPHLLYTAQGGPDYDRAAAENTGGQSALWPLGISGDLPILLASPSEHPEEMAPYLRICRRLALCGLPVDLALIDSGSEPEKIKSAVNTCARQNSCEQLMGARGGIHLIHRGQADPSSVRCLIASARYFVPLGVEPVQLPVPEFTPVSLHPVTPPQQGPEDVRLAVADGVFEQDSFTVLQKPQVPWCHVLANTQFGTLVSDCALGYTWAVNARENKLTPWLNDPCSDNRGELLLLRSGDQIYDLLHGARAEFSPSAARWTGEADGVCTTVTVTVPPRGSMKYVTLRLENRTSTALELEAAYYIEPVLGVNRETARMIRAHRHADGLLLDNPYAEGIPGFAYLGVDGGMDCYCCDRTRFLAGEWDDARLLPLPDSCAAVCKHISLPEGGSAELKFYLAFSAKAEDFSQIIASAVENDFPAPTLSVQTPDPSLDQMVNTWLPHQIRACRIDARTAFYQCGGAWGLRDQLQDAGALILLDSSLLRRQILRACAHQFPQGDGLHWWHEFPGEGERLCVRGVRTRYSDDYVWIAYEAARYCRCTGDIDFLSTPVPYLAGEELRAEEMERYFSPGMSEDTGSVYEHAVRALERALDRTGPRGLPLIGGGDWNDGYNRIGCKGEGESVWLAQFLALTLDTFAPLCDRMEESWRARRFREQAELLRQRVEEHCYDGDRYLRAFFDNGESLGARGSTACAVDSLTQSFAVLCGQQNTERIHTALDTSVRELSDPGHRLIRLFTPPFDGGTPDPGYVASYPPGVRENGGQYTHAAVWLCMALLRAGRTDEGYALLRQINPAAICTDHEAGRRYRGEPYALAGDVTASPRAPGQAGWTLYTGSAGWFYIAAVEELLGIRLEDGALVVHPQLPASWDGYTADYRFGKNTRVHLTVRRGERMENVPLRIPADGGEHKIVITIC